MNSLILATDVVRHFVRTELLRWPERYEWSLQGFGMLRTYLSPDVRLHVWDPEYRVEDVSDIHDHPWHFESLIVSGSIENRRYHVIEGEPTHSRGRIVCGPKPAEHGAKDIENVRLEQWSEGTYHAGDSYRMQADELHASFPSPGSVSIIRRTKANKDPDRALVYWPLGKSWVSAEPGPAPPGVVRRITQRALDCWTPKGAT